MDWWSDFKNFTKDAATPLSVLAFFATYAWTEWQKMRSLRSATRKYLTALAVEIDLNTESLASAGDNFPSSHQIRQFIEFGPAGTPPPASSATSVQYRPHIIHSYIDTVYKANVAALAELPEPLVRSIIEFYERLEWIDEWTRSVDKPSFGSISIDGASATIDGLAREVREGAIQGEGLATAIRLALTSKRFV